MARLGLTSLCLTSVFEFSACACMLAAPAQASAQTLRGVVTSPSGAGWSGVLVTMLDSSGAMAARDVTDTDGRYHVTATHAGVFRLRIARIGYQPITTPPLRLAAGEAVLRESIVFTGRRISQDTITIVGRRSCEPGASRQVAATQLWEQARTALRVADLSGQRRLLEASLVVFERRLDPGNAAVRAEQSRPQRVTAVQPWVSVPIDSLRRNGYVVRGADGSAMYHAPGLDAIASDQFVADHCFRVERGPDSGSVAVVFEPTRERRRTPEIAGTAWLDRATAALRRIDFRYVNIPPEQQAGAGASLEFLQLSNGAWIISRWEIRMPVLRREYTTVARGARVARLEAHEIRVEGGELAVAARGRDTLWTAPHLFLAGVVVDSLSGRPVPGASVGIPGTSFNTSTDSAGRFRIANVPLGNHRIRVSSDSLSLLGTFVEANMTPLERSSPPTLRTPAARHVAAVRCRDENRGTFPGVLAGRLAGSDADSVDAEVLLSWGGSSADTGDVPGGRRSVRTDHRGVFISCGLPLTEVAIEAVSDSGVAAPVRVQLSDVQPVAVLGLVLKRRSDAGVLTGTIISDADGRALADVEVAIRALGLRVFSDTAGRFYLRNVPVGEHTLDARRIGYRGASHQVVIAAGVRTRRNLVLSRVAVLEAIEVEAGAPLPGFEEHRRVGLGTFITRADIEKTRGAPLSTLMREIPAVRVVGVRAASVASNRRAATLSGVGFKCPEPHEKVLGYICACYAQVYLDNQLVYRGPDDPFFDINSIPPESVEAIEYYSGPAQTPARYSRLNSQCGVVVIHTRRYSPDKPSPH